MDKKNEKETKTNSIAAEYGNFLAALMKKEFPEPIGIEYIAVGKSGGENDYAPFKNLVAGYFAKLNNNESGPFKDNGSWAWAKKINEGDIKYLDAENQDIITNKLKIEVTINEDEPADETFDFREFALLGIYRDPDTEQFDTGTLYFINYVTHGQITKDNSMKLTRTITLNFPIKKES